MRTRASSSVYPPHLIKRGHPYSYWLSYTGQWGKSWTGVKAFFDLPQNVAVPAILPVFKTLSTITDGTRDRNGDNEVVHVRSVNHSAPFYALAHETAGSWATRRVSLYGGYYGPCYNLSGLTLLQFEANDNATLFAEAHAALLPQFKAQFDATNFALELKDFKGLGKQVEKLGKAVKEVLWINKPKEGLAALGKYARKDKTLMAAEAQLSINYAVKPFMRDVAKVHDSVIQSTDALSRFNEQGSKVNRMHFTKTLESTITSVNHLDSASTAQMKTYIKRSVVFNASADAKWVHQVDGSLDKFLQTWGLNLSPKTVWNAVPFSFVVDYFLSVGKMMDSLSRNSGTKAEMSRVILSWKSRIDTVTVLRTTQNTGFPSTLWSAGTEGNIPTYGIPLLVGEVAVAASSRSSYTRTPSMPFSVLGHIGIVLPRFKWASVVQTANLAALYKAVSSRKHKLRD